MIRYSGRPAKHPEQNCNRETVLRMRSAFRLVCQQQDRAAKSANSGAGTRKEHLLIGFTCDERNQEAECQQRRESQRDDRHNTDNGKMIHAVISA